MCSKSINNSDNIKKLSSTITNQSKVVLDSITDAYLTITQDTAQGISAMQKLLVMCNEPKSKELCLECIKNMKTTNKLSPEQTKTICDPICNCNVSNVNLNQSITFNSKLFLEYNNQEKFSEMVLNNISQKANREQTGIYFGGDKVKNTSEIINRIYKAMRSNSFQTAIDQMKNQQNVVLIGPGDYYQISLKQAADYISSVLQTNSETSKLVIDLQTNIAQVAAQVSGAGLDQLIIWIIRIVILILILILFLYFMNLVFQVYTLYV